MPGIKHGFIARHWMLILDKNANLWYVLPSFGYEKEVVVATLTATEITEIQNILTRKAQICVDEKDWRERTKDKTIELLDMLVLYSSINTGAHIGRVPTSGVGLMIASVPCENFGFWLMNEPGARLARKHGIVVDLELFADPPFFPFLEDGREDVLLIPQAKDCVSQNVHTVFYQGQDRTIRFNEAGVDHEVRFLHPDRMIEELKAECGIKQIREAFKFINFAKSELAGQRLPELPARGR